jgi:erythromycin esterase
MAKQASPTRKIIFWAATSHIIRHRDSFRSDNYPIIPMGDWIDKAMGPEVYTLGFTTYRGKWGTVAMSQPRNVDVAAEGSLEDLLFKADFEYAWLDLRNPAVNELWLQEPLSSRPLRYEPRTADWTRIMDGMFFIRDMFPSTSIETK